MGKTLVISKKEAGSLLNEKTLVLALIIQLMIASLSSLLVMGLASFFDPQALDKYDLRQSKIGIIGEGDLNNFLEKSRIRQYHYPSLSLALDDFNRHRIDAIIVIPEARPSGNEIIEIMLYLPKSDIKGTIATVQLKKPFEEFEGYVRDIRGKRIGFEPVKLYVDDIPRKTSTYFEFIYGVLIPLLVFTPVFISGGLIIDMLTEEYERKTMDLLRVSPVSFPEILNGKMLTSIIIVPLQAFLWLTLVSLNRVAIYNITLILLLVSIIAVIVVMIGAIIAISYKKRIISQYIYSLILILLFLLGYLFADSPFNLATRLSSGAMGMESLTYFGLYAALIIPFYMYLNKIRAI
ncbi:MAG: ABC transporter permease [Candidatus Methanoperedens sp.]|nr:ABC transporter permease [Candidatus Methanoperedens sp.]